MKVPQGEEEWKRKAISIGIDLVTQTKELEKLREENEKLREERKALYRELIDSGERVFLLNKALYDIEEASFNTADYGWAGFVNYLKKMARAARLGEKTDEHWWRG